MTITKKTDHQITNLVNLLNLPPCARAMIERIAAEAAHDAHTKTAAVCRSASRGSGPDRPIRWRRRTALRSPQSSLASLRRVRWGDGRD